MNKIAVYGTLRRGASANGLMRSGEYQGETKIRGKMFTLGRFPGVRLGGDSFVVVDVYTVPEDTLARLDIYEGYDPRSEGGSFYVRRPVRTVDGEEVETYEFNDNIDNLRVIESGDWFNQ